MEKLALISSTLMQYGKVDYCLSCEPVNELCLNQNTDRSEHDTWFIDLKIASQSVTIMLQITDWDFLSYPKVALKLPLPNSLGVLRAAAHFGPGLQKIGAEKFLSICYSPADAFSIPRHWPEKIVSWSIKQSIDLIYLTLNDNTFRKAEIYREVVPAWLALTHTNLMHNNFLERTLSSLIMQISHTPTQRLSKCIRTIRHTDRCKDVVVINIKTESKCFVKIFDILDWITENNSMISLERFLKFVHSIDSRLKKNILKGIESEQVTLVENGYLEFVLIVRDEMFLPFAVSIPKDSGVESSVVNRKLNYGGKSRAVPQLSVHPQIAYNLTPKYIFKRNLVNIMSKNLCGLDIVLVGCGALGGQLAISLVRVGAGADGGTLRLIDPDLFAEQNLGRHVLGKNQIGRYKATAICDLVKTQFDGINIVDINNSVLDENITDLASGALIIDATGKIEVSEALNERYQKAENKKASLLHLWIVANGEAVQGLLVEPLGEYACRSCLQPSGGRFEDEYNATPGVVVKDGLVACQSFTPFSVSAALSAAALGVDMTLDWVNGNVTPRYRTRYNESWQGRKLLSMDPHKFRACDICGIEAAEK